VSGEYWVLALALPGEPAAESGVVDALTNFAWEAGAVGVVEEGGGTQRLLAYFPAVAPAELLRARVAAYLEDLDALGMPVGRGEIVIEPLRDQAWADAWRAHFRPLRIGRRLLVAPPWEASAADRPDGGLPARVVVLIEPGRAFGTGGHASTHGCLELLERAIGECPVRRALDVGTGAGILAIAAARLGVSEVDAFDTDPDAVAAALANVERNGVSAAVRVRMASLDAWDGPPADLVLANLLGAAHVEHAARLARCVTDRGRLIAGGILAHEVPVVVGAFVPEGFRLVELTDRESWATLCLGRGI
jgi:ribosomal protein L11 methyltransferase